MEGAHKTGSAMVELANNLSLIFEKLYLKQVYHPCKIVSSQCLHLMITFS